MSVFFRGLRDDSLQNFKVLSTNEMGLHALEGLMNHARSLRSLTLSSLGTTSLPFLHLLTSLQYLEELNIEASTTSPPSMWAPDGEDPLPMLAIWLKGCKFLKQLSISKLAGGSKLLSDVLVSPDLQLRQLHVALVDDDEAFYSALGHQADLETLVFRSYAEITDQNRVRHDKLLDSLCSCIELRNINIIQEFGVDQVQLTTEDLFLIKEALRNLEELSFDGENLTDSIFVPLAQMPSLRAVYINGLSLFTYAGIKFFIEALQATGSHHGFRLEVASQRGDAKIPVRLEKRLARLINSSLDGYFSLVYSRDLSEDDTPSGSD
ncbi:hypothetical protein VPNG_00681 [Cytospora leucostoma]|uniref:F-box domain-containing protein n=1 Tax=Cytospora leucostoma TaxID=1230097 RepID=A0A423XMQ2_9PEZI|nr:hypothetical protein VPNG_00681 [Cytospora leucostoma]